MTLDDLDSVVQLHRLCFPVSISVFSAFSHDIVRRFYAQFVEEAESHAAVLEEPGSGCIVGVTFGTSKPGFQKRFLKRHRFRLFCSIIKGLLTGMAVWKSLWARLRKKNSLSLGEYDSVLAEAGVPAPSGLEDLNMGIAVHPDWRGGGNAAKLIEYYTAIIFKTGVVRIRTAILTNNVASMFFFKRCGWKVRKVSDTQVSVWFDRSGYDS